MQQYSDESSSPKIHPILNRVKAMICNANLLISIGIMGFKQFAGYALIVGFAGKILHSGEKVHHNITTNLTRYLKSYPLKHILMFIHFYMYMISPVAV